MIYSGFAGIGKTHASKHKENILDLESSQFQWVNANDGKSIEESKGSYKEKNKDWPSNYINRIKTEEQLGYTILISAQPRVLSLLKGNGLKFVTVTPNKGDKVVYLTRYMSRGNSIAFVQSMQANFDKYIDDLDNNEDALYHIKLNRGDFISSIFYGVD